MLGKEKYAIATGWGVCVWFFFGRLKGFSTPYPFRHPCAKAMYAANLTLENNPVAMGHTIDVRFKSYAWFKPNATFESIAAVNG